MLYIQYINQKATKMKDMRHLLNPQNSEAELVKELEKLLKVRERTFGQRDLRPINGRIRFIRVKLAKLRGTHTKAEWKALVAEFDRHCVVCGNKIYEQDKLCKSYIVPIAMGGSDSISNLMPTCHICATAKGASTFNFVEMRRQERLSAPKRRSTDPLE